MKPDHAPLFLLAAFAATAFSEELRPHDVPLACANICGPIVELTSICRVNSPAPEELRRLKRRRLVAGGLRGPTRTKRQGSRTRDPAKARSNDRRQLGPDGDNVGVVAGNGNVIGEFKTIPFTATTGLHQPPVPDNPGSGVDDAAGAPGGFRTLHPDNANQHQTHLVTPTTTLDLRPTATPTFIDFIIEPPLLSPSPTSPLTTTSTAVSTSRYNLPVGNGGPANGALIGDVVNVDNGIGGSTDDEDDAGGNVVDEETDKADGPLPDQEAQQEADALATACTCSNDSFDVARVAALCADCISQMNDPDSPMKMIMRQCNFASEDYLPAKDSVVANVRVHATRPLLPGESAASRATTAVGWWAVAMATAVAAGMIVM